jgi:threonine dehydratase
MVHPYDDAAVIAGQGTIALEMLEQQPDIDCLCVAIGGGGLISGVATAARALKPGIGIIGVQTDQFPSMYAAFKGVEMASANATLAEGIAVKSPGEVNVEIVKRLVDDVLLVSEGDIEQAIVMLLEIEKTVVEGRRRRRPGRAAAPQGALHRAQAGVDPVRRQHRSAGADRRHRTRHGARRAAGAHPRAHARRAGELARAATLIGQTGANIEEVEHQRAFTTLPVQNAELEFVLHTRGPEHIEEVLTVLRAAGLFAKTHPYGRTE